MQTPSATLFPYTTLFRSKPEDYDALVLPGGVVNADALRIVEPAQRFAKAIEAAGKPLAVICHGGWLLVSAGLVDRKSTRLNSSHPSISYAVFCLKKKRHC